MCRRGIRPDLILFADTGGELPAVYAYLAIMDAWLRSVGFPPITTVRYEPTRATYTSLEQKCLTNQTLPSLAFGKHSCSLVFKVGPQDKFISRWRPALDAWSHGVTVCRAIGYDDSPPDRRRRAKADKAAHALECKRPDLAARTAFWYPLQDWGMDRVACIHAIAMAGLPPACKSACFYCPASKKTEVAALREHHPLLFQRALVLESGARNGRHGLRTVKGLGRTFSWADVPLAADIGARPEAELLRP